MTRLSTPLFASLVVALAFTTAACGDDLTDPGADSSTPRSDGSTPGADSSTPGADSSTPRSDGSTPGDDGGAPPTAPEVDIEIAATCEALTPCGGDVVGTWAYTDGCVSVDLDGIREACPSATIDVMATASGTIRIDARTVTRNATVWSEAEIGVPASCAFLGCAMIAELLAAEGDATCTDASGGGCDCTVRSTQTTAESDGYRLEGDSLVTDAGDTYDYCRSGSTLIYGERDGTDVFELSPL